MLQIQLFLQHANNPEHRDYRRMWKSLFERNYDPLKNRLRRQYSNIHLEEIEDILLKAFGVFQMQLIKKAALEDNDPIKVRFIQYIEERGFTPYLFNLCNWMALDFLETERRRAMNIIEIDQILAVANKREFYEESESIDNQFVWLEKIKNILNENLYKVFIDSVINRLTHREIAEKHNITENVSINRKVRAIQRIRENDLDHQLRERLILFLFIIISF